MCYVDGTFNISSFLDIVSKIGTHIQLIFESENHRKIPFLDVLVIRWDSFFEICVNRKPFSVSDLLHALSNHPPNLKVGTFFTYVHHGGIVIFDNVVLGKLL